MVSPISLDVGWRDEAIFRRLRGIDRTGVLWEFLRRDPAYIAWYESAVSSRVAIDSADGALADASQWVIHFR